MGRVARNVVGVAVGMSLSLCAAGANLYKWVDSDGNVVYQDTPPPPDVSYEEQALPESDVDDDRASQISAAASSAPVTLYAVPDCDSCDVVRLALQKRGVPFLEKHAGNDTTIQQELVAKAGRLEVPTVVVGEDVLVGYSRSALADSLDAAGYPGLVDATAAPADSAPAGIAVVPGDESSVYSGETRGDALEPALLDQDQFIPALDALEPDLDLLGGEDASGLDEAIGDLKDNLDTSDLDEAIGDLKDDLDTSGPDD